VGVAKIGRFPYSLSIMKQVYLDTFGCQMNVADTDRMELVLFHSGYRRTLEKEDADLIDSGKGGAKNILPVWRSKTFKNG